MRALLMYAIKLNGLYDILCAMSILDVINIPTLKNIHLSMFLVNCSESRLDHMLAYWIFTYGIIRLYSSESRVISYSYYIEAAFIANESLVKKTMHMDKAYFVICSSILLGYSIEKILL
jgi:hypothetical protein